MQLGQLLEQPVVEQWIAQSSREEVVGHLRIALDLFRDEIAAGGKVPGVAEILARAGERIAETETERLRPVVNATGIVLHTGLGRAVLPQSAVDALAGLNRCCNLQIDLDTGLRGKRNYRTERLLCELTGAEAAMLVNNNAAATLLVLTVFCQEREVIISRGQLIEIGGSFRLPDCIAASGATMVEVGTTNKTHLRDYEAALGERTGAILRVNPSNYRVIGFSKEVPTRDLVGLKAKQPVLVIDDLGCGALVDLRRFGLPHEPTVPESIAAGADLCLFSGDKLIGGPQAGIIVGRKELIQRIKKHPLTRMLRVGKMTDLALEQTLRLFQHADKLPETNPTYTMLTVGTETLRRRAESIVESVGKQPGATLRAMETSSAVGGGSLPGTVLPSWAVAIKTKSGAEHLSRDLRRNEPPIIGRIENDEVLLDMRTLLPGEEDALIEALRKTGRNE